MGIARLAAEEIQRRFNANMFHDVIEYSRFLRDTRLDSRTYHMIAGACLAEKSEEGFREAINNIQIVGGFCSTTAWLLSRCSNGVIQKSYEELSKRPTKTCLKHEDIEEKLRINKNGLQIDDIDINYEKGKTTPNWPTDIVRGSQVLVVCWDAGINAMGRAAVLCEVSKECGSDVCLLGLRHKDHGLSVWEPLLDNKRQYCIDLMSYADIHDLFRKGLEYARKHRFETVWVSKTRPVSLIIGYIYKLVWNAMIIVDVDDYEASFSGTTFELDEWIRLAQQDLGSQTIRLLRESALTSESWCLYAERMVNLFDAMTVSSEAINNAYSRKGLVVRHLRHLSNRKSKEEWASDKVNGCIRILFNGTIRDHKGVPKLIAWLSRIASEESPIDLFLYEQEGTDTLVNEIKNRYLKIRLLRDVKYSDNIAICSEIDIVCALQDNHSLISKYQTPAKISDAVLAGARIIATGTEPIRELKDIGVQIEIVEDDFDRFKELVTARREGTPHNQKSKKLFSIEHNTVDILRLGRECNPEEAEKRYWLEKVTKELTKILAIDISDVDCRYRGLDAESKFDVVYVWRQSDTGDYPRRQHAIARRLAKHKRIGHVLHLEPSVNKSRLEAQKNKTRVLARYKGIDEDKTLSYHTFIYESRRVDGTSGGFQPLNWQGEFISKRLAERSLGIGRIMWVYPPFQEIGWLISSSKPDILVADFVDNVLTDTAIRGKDRNYIEEQYRYFASNSDLQLVNCESMKEFIEQNGGKNIVLVENAYPSRDYEDRTFSGTIRKCIYTGNMNGRLDWDLLMRLASVRKDIEFILYGECRLDVEWLVGQCSNVSYKGIGEPEKIQELIDSNTIALVPHLENKKTEYMNPIKYYEYRRMGVPVVTTCKWNIPKDDHIYYARTVDEVIEAFELIELLGRQNNKVFFASKEFIGENSWQRRMDRIWKELDKIIEMKLG